MLKDRVHRIRLLIVRPFPMGKSSYTRLPIAGLVILIAWTLIDLLAHRLFLATTPAMPRFFLPAREPALRLNCLINDAGVVKQHHAKKRFTPLARKGRM
jgi:hypothetical protein